MTDRSSGHFREILRCKMRTYKMKGLSRAMSHTESGKITGQKFFHLVNLIRITKYTHTPETIINGIAKENVISARQRSVWKYWYDEDDADKVHN